MIMYGGGSTDNRPFGSSAAHSCNTGYTLTGGNTTRVCVAKGSWSGSPPICQFTCSDLTVPANGVISYTMVSPRPVDTVATYTCDTGFILIGSETITYLSTGNWSSSPSSCQIPPPVYLSLFSTNYLSGLSEIPLFSVRGEWPRLSY
ncbi:P-selectin-like [Halichondria panicea]|uniref:P-selectin-like n=1 Tax=Halichondria panicea TaxID=6063 RepID=UPI00312B4F97